MLWVLQVMRCVLLCTQKAVEGGLCLLEVLEVMRRVLLCMLRAVEGELCLLDVLEAKRCMPLGMLETLEVPEVMRRVLLCMLEAVEGELCLLDVLEVMRCVRLCMLETVEGELCLLEELEVLEMPGGAGLRAILYNTRGCGGWALLLEAPKVPEVMRCVLLYAGRVGVAGDAGGDTPRGCGGWALLAGGAGVDALCATGIIRGCGEKVQFRGFEISIVAIFSSQSSTHTCEDFS